MNKKVSELEEAMNINDDDVIMIIQKNQNKKAKSDKLYPRKRTSITLESVVNANTNYTIPLSYKVGNNSLEVFYCNTKLEKRKRLQRSGRSG